MKRLAWLLLLLAGCDADEALVNRAPYDVRDSAGIAIVRTAPSTAGDAPSWRIDEDPVLQIGSVDGDGPYLFQGIRSAVRLPDGRIAASDTRDMDVRIFGSDGSHLITFGGHGQGPGEFGRAPILAYSPPDTLIVWDSGNFRITRFDLSGNLLSEVSLTEAAGTMSFDIGSEAWQLNSEGRLLYYGTPAGGIFDGVRRLTLLDDSSGAADVVGDYPAFRLLRHPTAPLFFADWFSPSTQAVLTSGRPSQLAIASADEWEIKLFHGSQLLRVIRPAIPRQPVTAEARERRRENFEGIVTRIGATAGSGVRLADGLPTPDSLPAIGQLLGDKAGNLWASRREVDPADRELYEVFDHEGRWLSSVSFPRHMGDPFEIGEDYVLAAWHDELGVPYLRQYRIQK